MTAHKAHEAVSEDHHLHNKPIAILIAVLAAVLAIVEFSGSSTQNEALTANIEASDTWAFYQAKNIRMTTLAALADELQILAPGDPSDPRQAVARAKIDAWHAEAQRLRDDPQRQGIKQLEMEARKSEAKRDRALAAYHHLEFSAAALQLAIVLASAGMLTEVTALVIASGTLGAVGTLLGLLGWLAPTLLSLS